jgi:hypothetical protein
MPVKKKVIVFAFLKVYSEFSMVVYCSLFISLFGVLDHMTKAPYITTFGVKRLFTKFNI